MTTNLLSAEQASFETGIGGWSAPTLPLVNMLTERQATVEGEDLAVASAVTYLLSGWAAGSTQCRVGRTHEFGTAALSLVRIDATTTWLNLVASPNTSGVPGPRYLATAGQTYTFMAEGRSSRAGNGAWRPRLFFFNAAGTQIGSVYETVIPGVDGAFTQGRIVAVAPAGTVAMCPGVTSDQPVQGSSAETFYFRRFGLFAGDVPLSGWVLPSATWGQNMYGAEYADVETNTITSTDTKAGWRQGTGTAGVVQWDASGGLSGTHSLRANTLTSTQMVMHARTVSPVANKMLPVTSGRAYTMMHFVKPAVAIPTATSMLWARYHWYKADGTTLITTLDVNMPEPVPTGKWTQFAGSAIAPAEAAWLYVHHYFSGLPNNTDAQYDCFAVYDGYVGGWWHPDDPAPGVRVTLAQATETGAPNGTHVLTLTRLDSIGTVEAWTTPQSVAIGRTYTAMASFASSAARTGRVYLEFLDAGGAVVQGAIGTAANDPGWNQAIVTGVAPAGAASVRLRVAGMNLAKDEVLRVDTAGLMDGPATSWVPGGQTLPASIEGIPDPSRHRIEIVVRDLLSDAVVNIERILPGGRIEPVRHAQGVAPTGGSLIVDDYDVPTDSAFSYRVTQGGATKATSAPVTLASAETFWLGEPNTGIMVRVIAAANAIPEWTREAPTGIHRVLGRQDPVVVVDTRWWAQGELTLYTMTEEQRVDLGDLFSLGSTLGFYGPQAIIGGIGRIYVVAPTVDERRVSARGYETPREWHSQITQVAEPVGPASAPLVVTWGAVVTAYDTWQDVVDGEHDWLDVMTGVPGFEPGSNVTWEW